MVGVSATVGPLAQPAVAGTLSGTETGAEADAASGYLMGYQAIIGYGEPAFDVTPNGTSDLTIVLPKPNPYDDDAEQVRLDGYTFTLQRVGGVDLSTLEGYKAAAHITDADMEKLGLEDVASDVTNAEGVVVFRGLPVGLYLVTCVGPDGKDAPIHAMRVILPAVGEDGGWLHQLTLNAKPKADQPTPTPTPTEPGQPTPAPTPTPSEPGQPTPTPSEPGEPSGTPSTPGVEIPTPSTPEEPGRLVKTGAAGIASLGAGIGVMAMLGMVMVSRRNRNEQGPQGTRSEGSLPAQGLRAQGSVESQNADEGL